MHITGANALMLSQQRSSIVIEGIKTILFIYLFFLILERKTNTNPTLKKPEKEFSKLNNQLSTKGFPEE